MSPLLADRHFKALAPVPWHLKVPQENTAPGASGLKVAFFVDCHGLPGVHAANHRHTVPGRDAGGRETHAGDLRRNIDE